MKNTAFWLKLSLVNFLIVAVLGVLMRYKIAYSFPFVDQKHVQEAHSHFAFYGWIAQIIYVFIIRYLQGFVEEQRLKKYHYLLIINMISAYAMIPSFLYSGYYWASIAASTAALLVSFVFGYFLMRDLKPVRDVSKPWFLAGLFFAVISSAGVFMLSYMMMSGNVNQDLYLGSTYYYLHFQYNGFFMFACIGLLLNTLKNIGGTIPVLENRRMFWLMFSGCVIGYGLSVLWFKMPVWLFVLIVIGTIAQTIASVQLFQIVRRNWGQLRVHFSALQRFTLLYVGFAFFVKIALQLGSNIPAVSQFAFGFRNVVIAYLHLILLMCISVFLVHQILASKIFKLNAMVLNSFKILLLGIFLNEAVLGLMGIFSIKYIALPYTAQTLLAVSVLMMLAIMMMVLMLKKADKVE